MQKEVIEALHYFHGGGYIDNLYGDGKHYTEILMNFAADKLNIELT
jgi:16S rRNA C1402 N4-methylase RsmH